MAKIKDLDLCQFYACKNPQHDDPSGVVTVQIPGEDDPTEVLSCIYHSAIASNGDRYAVGRTYRGEIEIRPIPAPFATPAATPAPQEA